ncbi:RNA polymerase II-associated [Pleurostoma richardsiae]|uniref:RNA polymerase II-associated n=1 Tax=Pleurostoma richardsiae TaxID=41990 RepID=A0AA38VNE9_9PEZI|nr:RNA polymerase II-associated [Pleurostoma richardsiae]
MSSSQSRGGDRVIHQDFIARIRFSNTLPPPPNPPKLLDIPNTGLSSGQYTTPGFASRLAREQPLNIEADAELGMPIDLVGMPGIFDGDESSIQAPEHAPHVHPHDRALLRPLSTLGKPKVADAAVSFLRRTEYISSAAAKAHSQANPLRPINSNPLKRPQKRKSPEPEAGSPAYIKRKIERSFQVAEQNLKNRAQVRHPGGKSVRLVDAYPLLPDLDAFPDSGAYVTIKFVNNPVPPSGAYDTRLLSGIFKPQERDAAAEAAFEAAVAAHELDPENNPRPPNFMNYDLYLADTPATAEKFRGKFDVANPERDDEALYTARSADAGPCFQFNRVRAYETANETELDHSTKYDDEVILAFSNGGSAAPQQQKAVWYYPVMDRSTIRTQRTRNINRTMGFGAAEEGQTIDQLEVTVESPTEEIREYMLRYKEKPLGFLEEEAQEQEHEEEHAERRAKEEDEDHQDAGHSAESPADNGASPATANGRHGSESPVESEQDAEGDEEE